jgi:predicted Zn-dependent protease
MATSSDRPRSLIVPASADKPRILSRADSEALFKRVVAMTTGGGDTQVSVRATWTANLSWGRNRPVSSVKTIEHTVAITRWLNGQVMTTDMDRSDDATLKHNLQLLEGYLASLDSKKAFEPLGRQEYLTPTIWNDATYQMTWREISDAARKSVDPVVAAKMVAKGHVEISAVSWAIFNTRGLEAYSTATGALYMGTVFMPDGNGAGAAGKSHYDWSKLDVTALAGLAIQKCRDSANPVKVEPGRYTAILEPEAVKTLVDMALNYNDNNRGEAEENNKNPYNLSRGESKIGQRIFDSRITITSDPMDPECGYIPFDPEGFPYRKVTWVENGVLKELAYNREYAREKLGTDIWLPNPMAYRVSGGDTSIDEMIATTERGIYVTMFAPGSVWQEDDKSMSLIGSTRYGLWLVEHGKIVHPIMNLWIYESPLIVLNQVEQIGPAVRTVGAALLTEGTNTVQRDLPSESLSGGHAPFVAPPMKVRDFNFTRLIDAV